MVVDKEQLRQAHQHWLAVLHLVLGHDARPDDLLGRDTVDTFGVHPHELLTAAADDVRAKPIGPQVGHHLQHRLIDKIGVGAFEARVWAVSSHCFAIASNSSLLIPAWVAPMISDHSFSVSPLIAPGSPDSAVLNGSSVLHSGCPGASARTRSSANIAWVKSGCSTHNVPS